VRRYLLLYFVFFSIDRHHCVSSFSSLPFVVCFLFSHYTHYCVIPAPSGRISTFSFFSYFHTTPFTIMWPRTSRASTDEEASVIASLNDLPVFIPSSVPLNCNAALRSTVTHRPDKAQDRNHHEGDSPQLIIF
jgi:hypothetical protein